MSTFSSAIITDGNLVLKDRTHRIKIKILCISILSVCIIKATG